VRNKKRIQLCVSTGGQLFPGTINENTTIFCSGQSRISVLSKTVIPLDYIVDESSAQMQAIETHCDIVISVVDGRQTYEVYRDMKRIPLVLVLPPKRGPIR